MKNEFKYIQQIEKAKKFVVPHIGSYCEIRRLSHHAGLPKGGTANFFDLLTLLSRYEAKPDTEKKEYLSCLKK